MEMEESTRAAGASSPAVGHRVFLAASLAAINNLAFGYDVGVISGSLADMASTLDLSTLEQEAATSGLNFLAGFGALLVSGNLLDRLGRRHDPHSDTADQWVCLNLSYWRQMRALTRAMRDLAFPLGPTALLLGP